MIGLTNYGFVRVGSAVPEMKVADCIFNTEKILELMEKAAEQKVYITVFPELCITGYTCGDLFGQRLLLSAALDALGKLKQACSKWNNVFLVGLPLMIDQQLYNCGLVLQHGHILGVVPKRYIPNYNEFYEKRWFREGRDLNTDSIRLFGQDIPCGIDLIFHDNNTPGVSFAIEMCEDMWMPVPPSSIHALNGAVILCNLSASNEIIGKYKYREMLAKSQSGRCIAGYVYTSAGVGESSTDLVIGGHGIIEEYGSVLGQTQRFRKDSQLLTADIDVCKLIRERVNATSFTQTDLPRKSREVQLLEGPPQPDELNRNVDPHPFVPSDPATRDERCQEVFSIQAAGLEKRYLHTKLQKAVLGISGGLDSALALLVTVKAFDSLGIPRKNIIAVTMPGFGTTNQSYHIAIELMQSMGVEIREINITQACLQHFKDIGHDPAIHDVTYENVQARERTQILMDIANKEGGLVIGTGDLSELALGWCTYNGDHMSFYSVNSSVPKTLVISLVKWAAEHILEKETADLLYRVIDMPISPELLPPGGTGEIEQKTEAVIGPYELHDFFLYHMIRYGADPLKIIYLAKHAFRDKYDEETIKKWLKVFYRRFFSQQFKRSCLPDGPKVGTISLSPRGDWRMPSDASARVWLEQLD